jgi:hypothetical protein
LAKGENATKLIEYLTVTVEVRDSNGALKHNNMSRNVALSPSNEEKLKVKFSHRDSMELSGLTLQQISEKIHDEDEEEEEEESNGEVLSDDEHQSEESGNDSPVYVDEEKLEKRIHKYPRLAAEILCSDIDQLYTTIIGDKVLLSTLFGFLSSETPLNPTLAGYWIRVMRCLFQRRIFDVSFSVIVFW